MTVMLSHFNHAPWERLQTLSQEDSKDALNAHQVCFRFLGKCFLDLSPAETELKCIIALQRIVVPERVTEFSSLLSLSLSEGIW